MNLLIQIEETGRCYLEVFPMARTVACTQATYISILGLAWCALTFDGILSYLGEAICQQNWQNAIGMT